MTIERYTHHIEYTLRRKYFTRQGRGSLEQFWCFVSAIVVFQIPGVLLMFATENDMERRIGRYVAIFFFAYFLLPAINAVVRRLHDTNRSGMVAVRLMGGALVGVAAILLAQYLGDIFSAYAVVWNGIEVVGGAVIAGCILRLVYLLALPGAASPRF